MGIDLPNNRTLILKTALALAEAATSEYLYKLISQSTSK
jgi:hypothetical protein